MSLICFKNQSFMSIISKKTTGFILLIGLFVILALNIILIQPISFGLILGTILFLVTLFLYKPKWGFLMFLFIRPSIDQFSEGLFISFRDNLSINASALLGALFIFLSIVFLLKNKIKVFSIPLVFPWIIFILISSFSIIFSIDKTASFYEVIRILSIFTAFILAFSIFKKEKNTDIFLQAILVSAIFPFAEAIYQLVTKSGLGGTFGIESRLMGTFSHPNSFASFALIIFAISVYFIIQKKKTQQIWYYLIAFLSLFIILETFSRGAWLALLVFGIVMSLFKSPKIILAIIGILLVLFLSSETFRYRVQDVYNPPATSSVRWRFLQWEKMYDTFIKKPITGYGAGTETIVHENEFGFYAGNPYTHNDILKTSLETGIFGALAYIFLIIFTSIKLFISHKKAKLLVTKNLALVVLALFLAEITFSMTSNIFRGTATQWILWSLIGVTLSLPLLKHQKSPKT
jgi:O-antigen ligase